MLTALPTTAAARKRKRVMKNWAAYWHWKAAEAGLAEAQDNLGDLYMTGRGVPKGKQLAEQWFRKAAAQGYPRAKINLSMLLSEPRN
jgi:uncharacterized protein